MTVPEWPSNRLRKMMVILLFGSVLVSQSIAQVLTERQNSLVAGQAAAQRGEFVVAESLFIRATRLKSTAARAHFELARLYVKEPLLNPAQAYDHLQTARELEPDNIDFIRERLKQLRSAHDFFGSTLIREDERLQLGRLLTQYDASRAEGFVEIGIVNAQRYLFYRDERPDRLRRRAIRAYENAVEALENVIESDPTHILAYGELIKLYLRGRLYQKALELSGSMRTYLPRLAESWLMRGMILLMSGSPEEAGRQFQRALAIMSVEERPRFETTDILAPRKDPEAEQSESEEYRDAFWRKRDVRRLTATNERLTSHYARITYADLFYPKWRSHMTDPWIVTPGDVIVRYGIPSSESHADAPGVTWTVEGRGWLRPTAWTPAKLFLVIAGKRYVFEDEFQNEDYVVPTVMQEVTYSPSGNRIKDDPITLVRDEFFETPDKPDPPEKATFPMPYLVSRFRNSSGASDVVVGFGIPVKPTLEKEDVPLAVTTGVFLVDEEGRNAGASIVPHSSLDRTRIWSMDSLQVWTDAVTFTTDPGQFTVQVEAESEHLVSYSSSPLFVDSTVTGFGVSDPLLALVVEEYPGEPDPGEIVRNRFRIRPAGARLFSHAAPVYLYFEAYDLTPDATGLSTYQVTVVLEQVDESTGFPGRLFDIFNRTEPLQVALSFTTQITATNDAQYVTLDLSDHEPGSYRIALRLRDETTGAETYSSQQLILN